MHSINNSIRRWRSNLHVIKQSVENDRRLLGELPAGSKREKMHGCMTLLLTFKGWLGAGSAVIEHGVPYWFWWLPSNTGVILCLRGIVLIQPANSEPNPQSLAHYQLGSMKCEE